MTILELREKRNKAWEAAKAFVETKRDKDGLLSAEDVATYAEMEQNSVKSYCRRNKLSNEDLKRNDGESSCEQCGTIIHQVKGRKRKRFCSDKCRNQWWNSHLDQVKRKKVYEYVCPVCGKPFSVYGNAKRKYCSHDCYVIGRFGSKTKS